ncbi:substrate-binding domain-containing protein, partial [Vibrio parahaemolyticus]|nr:substrate-binding domain-containing protein [Vibrio parahaemolyticus]
MALRLAKTFSLFALVCSFMAAAQDKPLPSYHKTTGIVGNLLSVGSDTLAGMTTLWVEEFKSIYPNINAQVQASGSSTAPPALTEQTAQFGPMSRPMRLREIEAFEREHGYKPTAL